MKWIALFCLFPIAALAQGFAGLGSQADGFADPQRDYAITFPADHGPHPDFRIEWWYLTANLTGADGLQYGLQWTLFRSALAPFEQGDWKDAQIWMGHSAITTPSAHYATERLARGGIGQAGVQVGDGFDAWIDDWHMRGARDLGSLELKATGPLFSYQMDMSATGPLVLQGDQGFSVKSAAGQASHYYSQPFFSIEGVLTLPDGDVAVTGNAWLDREWSSQPLGHAQTGWDWFSLSFDDGARMMGFVLRSKDEVPYTSATWIDTAGDATPLPDGAFNAVARGWSETAGRKLPTRWELTLPEKDLNVTVSALNGDAWMPTSVPYWEGPINIEGTHTGVGYLEMTGY